MLHQIGEAYHQTPAQQLGITDLAVAFCINRAALWAGSHEPPKKKAENMAKLQRRGGRR